MQVRQTTRKRPWKTGKTIRRDLNHIQEIGAIRKTPAGFTIRPDKLFAFLPPVRVESNGTSGDVMTGKEERCRAQELLTRHLSW